MSQPPKRHDSGETTIPIPRDVLAKFRIDSEDRPRSLPVMCIYCVVETEHDVALHVFVCPVCGAKRREDET